MPRSTRKLRAREPQRSTQSEPQAVRGRPSRFNGRALSLILIVLALAYGFLAGFHTILDLDLGFHLATGRYVVQHHTIPSTDVLSYTARGKEWLYPPFGGVLLYGIVSTWGYGGLSWFCALALMAMVALLLRSPSKPECSLAAALAILAVPALASRASPRPDLLSHVFFAIFLVLLWWLHQTIPVLPGNEANPAARRLRQWLWILPPLMVLWVNCHPGFVAGLGVVFAYVLIEILDLLIPSQRGAALWRMKQAWPALLATVFATLLNPFGSKVFKAALVISGLQGKSLPSHGVAEWQSAPLSFASISEAMDWRDPGSSFLWLALAALATIAVAVWRRQLGTALLVAVALYSAVEHNRLEGMFALVAVVVGSSVLAGVSVSEKREHTRVARGRRGIGNLLALIAAGVIGLVTCVRIADVVSSRSYEVATSGNQFGPGESWWFPERAAAFIKREHLPGNVFQKYELGGFTAWRLGPEYSDFIDGRFDHMAPAVMDEQDDLLASPDDSSFWQTEADRWSINILFLSLARIEGLGSPDLASLCRSQEWRPVYMDEVSIVMLRNRPENRPWMNRLEVDCQTHSFAPPAHAPRIALANFYANAGVILMSLNRIGEAMKDLESATALAPDDPIIHVALAQLYDAQGQADDAEREYKAAMSLEPHNESTLHALGRFYISRKRFAEARPLIATAAHFSAMPQSEYGLLGVIDADLGQPQQSLSDFARAEELGTSYWQGREDKDPQLFAQIAAGRASAYAQLGDLQRAVEAQQEATRLTPENAYRWSILGDLYARTGQLPLSEQAYQRASALSK